MAKPYFRYGVMGSSKTANALMVRYNYEERGQEALLVKPAIDQRDGARFVASRAGLSHPCVYFSDLMEMSREELSPLCLRHCGRSPVPQPGRGAVSHPSGG